MLYSLRLYVHYISTKNSRKNADSQAKNHIINKLHQGLIVGLIGLIIQYILVIAQIFVYIKTFKDMNSIYNKNKPLDKAKIKKLKNEYWTFFVLFLVFDICAVTLIIYFGAKINGWIIYTLFTSTIIPIFISESLRQIYLLNKFTIYSTIYLVPNIFIKVIFKKTKNIKIKYEEAKTPKLIRCIYWKIK